MKSNAITSQYVYITTGSVDRPLAERIAAQLGLTLNNDEIKTFPSGERYFRYVESVRGKHVLIIQSLVQSSTGSVNDALIELVLMIDAARRASASEITVVSPYLAYMRQDRKARGREPISAAAIINLLQTTGAHRLVSIDMHSAQTQAVFDGPFDHLTAQKLIYEALKTRIDSNNDDFLVISPDGGRAKTAETYAQLLEIGVEHIPKKRDRSNSAAIYRPDTVEGVEGKHCILIDDMIDTAGTLVSAAKTLQTSGVKSVIAVATHGLLSDPAVSRIKESAITELFITDTIPTEDIKAKLGNIVTVIPTAAMIASSLTAIVSGGSLMQLFEDRNYY